MVLDLTAEQFEWLAQMQRDWNIVMKPFSMTDGWSEQYIKRGKAFSPIPKLEIQHLRNAKLVPSREELLEMFPKGGIVGEIGTQHGYFAQKIHEVVCPHELHLFDKTFDPFNDAGLLSTNCRVIAHEGDAATNLATFPDRHFDWLYIDADHSYRGVKRDIEQAVHKIKGAGFLVFNDFTYWSPLEAAPYGVAHAVCELCLSHDWEITHLALEPWMYCDVVVRPRC
jgi:hypothetical protein